MSERREVLAIFSVGAIVLLITTAVLCSIAKTPEPETNEKGEYKNYRKIVADGCEYLLFDEFKTFQCITHKGNCKFCLERKR